MLHLGPMTPYLLDEGGPDVRKDSARRAHPAFFVGDHLGIEEAVRARVGGARRAVISVGPLSVHADDAVAILANELDCREAATSG